MPFIVTPGVLTSYADNKLCHTSYEITSTKYRELKAHANGYMPVCLIEERRPSESIEIKDYRQKIYQPMTKSSFTKVISSLAKIRRSPDWSIKFNGKKISSITAEETLEEYTTKNYPYSLINITNWTFGICLKNYLLDANAVILVMPINLNKTDEGDYYKPFPFIFNSPNVLDYREGEYAVLLSESTCSYTIYDSNGHSTGIASNGCIIHVVDDESVRTYQQTDNMKKMQLVRTYTHGLGYIPAFKMPGAFFETCGDTFINESRLSGMLPDLNEAVREYSDLQAEIVQHVHSTMWMYVNIDCPTCNGVGKEQVFEDRFETCHSCKGMGKISVSPYDNIALTPPQMGESAMPSPPAGYIQKSDVALMVTKMNEMFYEKLYNALAAINMQFLSSVPLSQSGKAKEVDKDELNNFVHSIAEDIVYIMDKILSITADIRYGVVVVDKTKRQAMLPKIAVPAVFDLLSSSYLVDEIKTAKDSGVATLIILALETEFAAKKFYNNPEVAQLLQLTFNLDPIPGESVENKALMLGNEGVSQEDYIISCNIVPFIKRALREDPDFASKEYDVQMQIMDKYATEKMPDPAAKITPEPDPTLEEIPVA